MIRGVFFDLYGTLLVYANMPAAWAAWRAELHRSLGRFALTWSPEELGRRCEGFFAGCIPSGGNESLTVYERRIRRLGREAGIDLPPPDLGEIAARTAAAWQVHIPLDTDAVPLLRELRAAGRKLALITNFDHPPHVYTLLARLDIARFFDAVVISGAEGLKKPDPAIFRRALVPLGLAPAEVVFVGDAPEDIAGAIAADIRPILLSRAGTGAGNAAAVIRNLRELPALL